MDSPQFPAPASAPAAGPASAPPADGWAVAAGHGLDWWGSGWRLFTAAPLIWIAIVVLFVAILFVLAFIPIVGQIASTLLYPVFGGGILLGARALERGEPLTVGHLFSCFNDKAIPLLIVAILYFAGWFLIWALAAALLVGLVGFGTLAALFSGDPAEAGMALASAFGLGTLVVLLICVSLCVPLVMAYWFASALVVFRGSEPWAAMKSSFAACLRNVPPFLVYSVLGIVFAVVASIPLGLGWLVLAPVYAATLYTSYKDIFGEPA
jgi:uncharacterized membrane protein